MGHRTISQFVLVCDGCGVESKIPPAASLIEARAVAFGDGWRFPAKLRSDGSQSTRANDVCAKCTTEWLPPLVRPDMIGHPSWGIPKDRVQEAS